MGPGLGALTRLTTGRWPGPHRMTAGWGARRWQGGVAVIRYVARLSRDLMSSAAAYPGDPLPHG